MNLEESIRITVEGCDAMLYDIVTAKEHDRNIYRVLVTAKGGINLDKCAEISRLISPILDLNEPLSGDYILEVSSPGIERKLKYPHHFLGSIGELIKVKNIATDIFKGELLSANNENIVIKTEFGEETLDYDSILSAATYFEW